MFEAAVMESRSLWNLRFEVAIASGMVASMQKESGRYGARGKERGFVVWVEFEDRLGRWV